MRNIDDMTKEELANLVGTIHSAYLGFCDGDLDSVDFNSTVGEIFGNADLLRPEEESDIAT